MATELDYYIVLGVTRTATDAEIKRAYRLRQLTQFDKVWALLAKQREFVLPG